MQIAHKKAIHKAMIVQLKMEEGSYLHHVNTFNGINKNLVRIEVKVDDEDKAIILLRLIPSLFDHLMTNLSYGKNTIKLDDITIELLSHSQRRYNAEKKIFRRRSVCKGRSRPWEEQW